MLSGLSVTFYYIVANHPTVQVAMGLSPQDTIWWGLEPIGAGVLGVPLGLLSGFLVSWGEARLKGL